MWDTQISALLNSPTVPHESGLTTAYENREAIFRRVSGRLLESRELAQGLKEEAGTSRVEKNPAGQQCSYCAGLARGWPFSAIKKTSTLVGPVVLVFFASWTTLAGLWNTSPAL